MRISARKKERRERWEREREREREKVRGKDCVCYQQHTFEYVISQQFCCKQRFCAYNAGLKMKGQLLSSNEGIFFGRPHTFHSSTAMHISKN